MPLRAAPALLVFMATAAAAFPDGAPWETAAQEGCVQCHFDVPAVRDSNAVTIAGLPERVVAGAVYRLTLELKADDMLRAGFLLSAKHGEEPGGRFTATDARTTTLNAQARSTNTGSVRSESGRMQWTIQWTAPDSIDRPIVLDVWTNSANDDNSPFGDATHHRIWRLLPAVASSTGG